MIYTLSLLAGFIIGFSVHRAGLCTVKAVAEIVTTRRAHVLWSFAKSALWVMAVAALVGTFSPGPGFRHWPLTATSVAGGVLFGLGAGLNGGCTFSTLSRLMDGNIGSLATVCGWPVGLMLGLHFWDLSATVPTARPATTSLLAYGPVVLALAIWALWEALRLMRRILRTDAITRILGQPVYTLSAAAALLGVANAALLETSGPWSFTGTFLCGTGAATLANCANGGLAWLIFSASLAGMAASAVQRGSFALRVSGSAAVLRHGLAGVMMGLGAVLIPGGNDGLILFAIPSLSPHALSAYGGIVAGILFALLSMRAVGRQIPRIQCDGDICRTGL